MTFAKKKETILNALIERKGLQYLTDIVSKVLNNPIFIYDVSGKFLAKSQKEIDNEIWKELFPEGHLDAEKMKITEKAGVFEQIMNTDEPVLGDFEYSRYRFLGCRIRDKDGAVGIATVVENHPLQADDYELLVIACKAFLYEMLYRERTAMQKIPYYNLLKDIIEENVFENEIIERCKVLKLKFPKTMRLLGIKFSEIKKNSLSLYFLRQNLLASIPECYCIIYDESLVLIIAEKYINDTLFGQIRQVFYEDDTRIGVSRIFSSILDLKNAFQEMKAIQSVYQKLGLDKPLTYYEDILLYHFMETASKETDLNVFCSPIVTMLENYDAENGTELKKSVEAYLESSRNIQRASEKLHIHKNTLYYRLKRAEELFNLDLSDENLCFTLQFSFRMKRMSK